MHSSAVSCSLALIALMGLQPLNAGAEPENQECPQSDADVVIRSLTFASEPFVYTFMVTNNSTRPITYLSIGADTRFSDHVKQTTFSGVGQPISISSPIGWWGGTVLIEDSSRPGSRPLTLYTWSDEGNPKDWIHPGQSLSGFSIQFPLPDTLSEEGAQLAAPDLSNVPFRAYLFGARCPKVGMVEPDRLPTRLTRQ